MAEPRAPPCGPPCTRVPCRVAALRRVDARHRAPAVRRGPGHGWNGRSRAPEADARCRFPEDPHKTRDRAFRYAEDRESTRALGSPPSLRLFLEHGQDIAGRVLEPRDQRPTAAEDAFRVRLQFTLVMLEPHAAPR